MDPSDCYTPEPEGEVGMSLSEGGHKGPPRSDLPAAEAVIPTTPVKQQSLKLEDTDMAEEVCKQLTSKGGDGWMLIFFTCQQKQLRRVVVYNHIKRRQKYIWSIFFLFSFTEGHELIHEGWLVQVSLMVFVFTGL